jgi:hypothetical protein
MILPEDSEKGRVQVQVRIDMRIPPTYINPVDELEPL